MEIRKNRQKKTTTLKFILVLIVLVLGALCYVYATTGSLFGWQLSSSEQMLDTDPDTTNLDKPTDEQTQAGQQTKSESVKNNSGATSSTKNGAVEVTVTAVLNDEMVRVQTTINKVTNTGKCVLTVSKGATVKTFTAGTQALSDYSTCKGFEIKKSILSPGTWRLSIKFNDLSTEGSASTDIAL